MTVPSSHAMHSRNAMGTGGRWRDFVIIVNASKGGLLSALSSALMMAVFVAPVGRSTLEKLAVRSGFCRGHDAVRAPLVSSFAGMGTAW